MHVFKGRGKDIMNNSKLRQEIEQLQTEIYNDGLHNDRISRLIEANEHLQAQNGAMREALAKAREALELGRNKLPTFKFTREEKDKWDDGIITIDNAIAALLKEVEK